MLPINYMRCDAFLCADFSCFHAVAWAICSALLWRRTVRADSPRAYRTGAALGARYDLRTGPPLAQPNAFGELDTKVCDTPCEEGRG